MKTITEKEKLIIWNAFLEKDETLLLKYLKDKDPNSILKHDNSPMYLSVVFGLPRVTKLLIKNGANVSYNSYPYFKR